MQSKLASDSDLPASAVTRGLYHLWPREMQDLVFKGWWWREVSITGLPHPHDSVNFSLTSVEASTFQKLNKLKQ